MTTSMSAATQAPAKVRYRVGAEWHDPDPAGSLPVGSAYWAVQPPSTTRPEPVM